jgi:hypothetical protein
VNQLILQPLSQSPKHWVFIFWEFHFHELENPRIWC